MGKSYKGKTCIYCGVAKSNTADHVIARQFFLPGKTGNTPKVPACFKCNNEKSRIEHYLTTVMPFGGRHSSASETLASLVPPRLANNRKLHSTLANGITTIFTSQNGGPWVSGMTLPIDPAYLERFFTFIVKGLAWHHWKVLFSAADHLVLAGFLAEAGTKTFEALLSRRSKRHETGNLGDGVFVYEGTQAAGCPHLTVWRMSLYGAEVGGDPRHPLVSCNNAYAITAPRGWRASARLLEILRMSDVNLEP